MRKLVLLILLLVGQIVYFGTIMNNITWGGTKNITSMKYNVLKTETASKTIPRKNNVYLHSMEGEDKSMVRFYDTWIIGPGTRTKEILVDPQKAYVVSDCGIVVLNMSGLKKNAISCVSVLHSELWDIDNDGAMEVVFANSTGIYLLDNDTVDIFVSRDDTIYFTIGDISPREGDEVSIVHGEYIELVSTLSAQTLWQIVLSGAQKIYRIRWDSDPQYELLVVGGDRLIVVDNDGSVVWNYIMGENISLVDIEDIDGDGYDDIVVAGGSKLWVFLEGGNAIRTKTFGDKITTIGSGDINETGGREIFLATNGTLFLLDSYLNQLWNRSLPSYAYATISTNVDLDDFDEIFMGGLGFVMLVDGNGSDIWTRNIGGNITTIVDTGNSIVIGGKTDWIYRIDYLGDTLWSNRIYGAPTIIMEANLVDDDSPEYVVAFSDMTVSLIDRNYDELLSRNMTVGIMDLGKMDYDGDSYHEVIVALENNTTLLMDLGDIVWRKEYNGSLMFVETPRRGDEVEIILSGDNGTIALYPNGTTKWSIIDTNVSALAIADIYGQAGEEILLGLQNGTIIILSFDGSKLNSKTVESAPILCIGAYNSKIVYGVSNNLKQLNTTLDYEWNVTVYGAIYSIAFGGILNESETTIAYLSSASFGVILPNGTPLFVSNGTNQGITFVKVNGTAEHLLVWNNTDIMLYSPKYENYKRGLPFRISCATALDTDGDLIEEQFIGGEIGGLILHPARVLTILLPKSGEILNTTNIVASWETFGFTPVEYRVYLNSTLLNTTIQNRITIQAPEDGVWDLKIQAIPIRGSSIENTTRITVDTAPPGVNIVIPTNNTYTNNSQIVVVWEGYDNTTEVSRYVLYVNDTKTYEGVNTTYNVSLTYGVNVIRVVAYDLANNSAESIVFTVRDDVQPRITDVDPENGTYVNTSDILLRWGYVEDFLDHFEVRVDNGEWVFVGNNTSYMLENLSYGEHNISIMAVDKAGNTNISTIWIFVDDRAPMIHITNPANNTYTNSSGLTVRYNISEDNLVHVLLLLNGTQIYDLSEGSGEVNISLSEEGVYVVEILAIDLANNTNTSRILILFDRTKPSIVVYSPTNNTYYRVQTIRLQWNTTDTLSGIRYVLMRLDENAWFEAPTVGGIVIDTGEGTHRIHIKAIDMCGNTKLAVVVVHIDVTPPTIDISEPENNTITNKTTVILCWRIMEENPDTVRISIDQTMDFEVNMTIGELIIELFGDGTHTISIYARDKANNSALAVIIVNVDSTPPSISIPYPENGTTTGNRTIEIVWYATDNTGIYGYWVKMDNYSWVFVGSRNRYTIDTLYIAEGNHTFFIKAQDLAGNTNIAKIIFIFQRKKETITARPLGILPGVAAVFTLTLLAYLSFHIVLKKKAKKRTEEQSSSQGGGR